MTAYFNPRFKYGYIHQVIIFKSLPGETDSSPCPGIIVIYRDLDITGEHPLVLEGNTHTTIEDFLHGDTIQHKDGPLNLDEAKRRVEEGVGHFYYFKVKGILGCAGSPVGNSRLALFLEGEEYESWERISPIPGLAGTQNIKRDNWDWPDFLGEGYEDLKREYEERKARDPGNNEILVIENPTLYCINIQELRESGEKGAIDLIRI